MIFVIFCANKDIGTNLISTYDLFVPFNNHSFMLGFNAENKANKKNHNNCL